MKKDVIVLFLSRFVYSDITINKKIRINHFKEIKELFVVSYIDKTDNFFNGLQACVFLDKENKEIYLISRGCDIGIGSKLFTLLGANKVFLPKYDKKNQFKSFFQDWIYSGMLCPLGVCKFYQFYELDNFFKKIINDYPDYNIIVGGSSLGGCLSQLIYINNYGAISKCITFSAITPWYILSSEQRNKISKSNYLHNDNVINYYSHYDVFRIYPFFPRHLGRQINVSLASFKTKSNFLATILERISWGHMTKYITFDKVGNIKIAKAQKSILSKLYEFMNKRVKYNKLFNSFSLLFLIVLFFIVFIFSNILEIEHIQKVKYIIQENALITILSFFLGSLLFLLPVFLIRNRWKYLIFLLLMISGINPFFWLILLILANFIRISSQ